RDAGAEVDQRVAVDVLDDAAARPPHVDRHGAADALGDRAEPALLERAGLGAGDLGDDPPRLGDLAGGHGCSPPSSAAACPSARPLRLARPLAACSTPATLRPLGADPHLLSG